MASYLHNIHNSDLTGIILELKANDTPEAAIAQVKSKEYGEKLWKERVRNILIAGLSYDTEAKEHKCVIEEMYLR